MTVPEIVYSHPAGVIPGNIAGRLVLTTPQGGSVVIDRRMQQIWEAAQNISLADILRVFPGLLEEEIRTALACLAEAGLLNREASADRPSPPPTKLKSANWGLISAVVVSYNSRAWLELLFPSLYNQTYPSLEVILVDNGSTDGSSSWTGQAYPQARVIRLDQTVSFAQALNTGVETSRGEAVLLLNPDLRLEPDFVARIADCSQGTAPAAARLRLMWAEAFLNGLGNFVGGFSWGTDFALGHLDLGQWDNLQQAPSACFAAALIPCSVWKAVSPVDPSFPMYYEDSEWSYRTRMLGYPVRLAGQAVAYHAFSGRGPGEHAGSEQSFPPIRLRRLVYGRLRFAARLLGPAYFLRFVSLYALEDLFRLAGAMLRGRPALAGAVIAGWKDLLQARSSLKVERRNIQQCRRLSDREVFTLQRQAPAALIWRGLPLLTWDTILSVYLPAIRSGRTRDLPEFAGSFRFSGRVPGLLTRGRSILNLEGWGGLLHKTWRGLQRTLMSV